MVGYKVLASQYDNYFYDEYLDKVRKKYLFLLRKNGKKKCSVLDAGCGTGMMTFFLKNNGYNVEGVDLSRQMLDIASEKDREVNFYCNDISKELPNNNYDAVVSCLDVVNHITNPNGVIGFFDNAFKSLNKDGILIFDINTYKKFSRQYASNRYVYSGNHSFCVWNNYFNPDTNICDFFLTVYTKTGDRYIGKHDYFSERYYSDFIISKSLKKTGFIKIESVTVDKGTRTIYIAKKS